MTVTTITGPGRVSQFIWGARQQHTLTLGYPAVLDNPRFWREPQAGSELNQVNDGQDAWITTRDYMASFAVRWLSPQDWARFQLFLDWATVGGVFTFVPDAAGAPQFGLTGCVLVDPFDKPVPTPEANGYQALNITFRNPTQDLGLAWRGLMFEYAPGADISPAGLNATFSRPSMSTYIGRGGPPVATGTATSNTSFTLTDNAANVVPDAYRGYAIYLYAGTGAGQARRVVSNTATTWTISVAWGGIDATSKYVVGGALDGSFFPAGTTDQLMDRHYPLGVSGGAIVSPRTTLLQAAATNKLTAPEDLSNAAWTKGGVTIPSTNNTSPRGDATACFVREDASNGQHHVQQGYAIAVAGNPSGTTFFLKARGRTKAQLIVGNVALTSWFGVIADLVAGTLTPNNAGTGTLTFSQIVPLANGEFMVQVYGKVDSGVATSVVWDLYLLNGAGASSYAGDSVSGMEVWGCVATDNQIAGMYWGVNASRSADSLTLPFSFAATAMWVYAKWVEGGAVYALDYPQVFNLGGGGIPKLHLVAVRNNHPATINYALEHWNGYSAVGVETPVISIGQTVEALSLLYPDGSVQMLTSINGGSVVDSGRTGTVPNAPWIATWSIPTAMAVCGYGGMFTNNMALLKGGSGNRINSMSLARAA